MQKQLFFIACVISAQATHTAHVATTAAGILIGVSTGLIVSVSAYETITVLGNAYHNRKEALRFKEAATATASAAAELFEKKLSNGVGAMQYAAHYHASAMMQSGIKAFRSPPYSHPSGYSYPSSNSEDGYTRWSPIRKLQESVDVAGFHRDFYTQQAVILRASDNVFGAEQCEKLAEQAQALYNKRQAWLDKRNADNNAENAAAIEMAAFDIEQALHLNA